MARLTPFFAWPARDERAGPQLHLTQEFSRKGKS